MSKPMTLPEDLQREFSSLLNQLSPENMSCDGEIRGAELDARYAEAHKKWRDLEKKAGRKVTEEEVIKNWSRA
jgi:hypothetical protein